MSSTVPSMPGFIPRQPFVPKSGLIPKVRVMVKNEDGDSTTKVVSGLAPSVKKETPACMSRCEQPTKPV